MHILFVWSYWEYPPVYLELLESIRKRGHDVSVMLGDGSRRIVEQHQIRNIDFHYLPQFTLFSRITGTPYPVFRGVSTAMREVNPDLVHANSHLFLSSYQAVEAALSAEIPSVITVHGLRAQRGPLLNSIQSIYLRTIGKLILQKTSAIICLTKSDAAGVRSLVDDFAKIFIIPNGVDVQLFKPTADTESDLVVWVGRLVPEKGLRYLLKAFQAVIGERPEARLSLVGTGTLVDPLKKYASELGLNGHVIFKGWANRKEVARIISRASVIVLPSLSEGQPRVILEAMASGVPVVGSDIPGIREVIAHRNTGLLVPPRDSLRLAESILKLLEENELRERMGMNARRVATENYSWDRVVERLVSVYSDVAG